MKTLAIIPARGGSKRIPRKNIKDFFGKPIIAYSIQAAVESELFDEVMVSTEDQEIADVATSFGAKVPFLRSKENADDYSTTIDVIKEVVAMYQDSGKRFNYGCCVYPTAPFVNSEILIKAGTLLIKEKFDVVFPVLEYSYPIQRALKSNSNGKMEMFYPKYLKTRSQDLERSFHDSGQFYFFETKKIIEANSLWTKNTGTILLKPSEGQDIDTLDDWSEAELKYKLTH